jgi:hypothetical protein
MEQSLYVRQEAKPFLRGIVRSPLSQERKTYINYGYGCDLLTKAMMRRWTFLDATLIESL